jgi:hypothetical protein
MLTPVAARVFGNSAWEALRVRWSLAQALSLVGDDEAALTLRQEVLQTMQENNYDPLSSQFDSARWNLALTLGALDRTNPRSNVRDRLDDLLDEIVTTRTLRLGDEHPDTIDAMEWCAKVKMLKRDFAAAEDISRKVLKVQLEVHGRESQESIEALVLLATALANLGNTQEAKATLVESAELASRVLGREHRLTWTISHNLSSLDAIMADPGAPVLFFDSSSDAARELFGEKF